MKKYKDSEILLARHPINLECIYMHCYNADNSYKCDPRVESFLAKEQEEKAAKRRAKEEAVRKKEQVKMYTSLCINVIPVSRRRESKKRN